MALKKLEGSIQEAVDHIVVDLEDSLDFVVDNTEAVAAIDLD